LFGISGNRRGGYQLDQLLEKLSSILGKDRVQNVVIVGAGHLAAALMKYKGFEKEGIKIVACFDIDPIKFNTAIDIPVYSIETLTDYLREHQIRIGIIAVPEIAAQSVLDQMVTAGIKGVLNFAPLRLRAPEDIVINNVNMELELENLIYFVNARQKAQLLEKNA
ncbi:MAG: redox-sensing transcriptional repressor Rex, partial [Candidatus Omnitrophota bacterium]